MRLINPGRLVARLLLAALSLSAGPAMAQDTSSLLPVTEAYKLSADASQPGVLKLHWDIAQDYYLYRGRMKFTAGEGITLGTAQLPDGDKHHDEYLGDVETYHHGIDARLPYTAAAGATRLQVAVQFQGCHEVDPKICYPPHTEKLDLPLGEILHVGDDLTTDVAGAIRCGMQACWIKPENAELMTATDSRLLPHVEISRLASLTTLI